tara:strand:- start:1039 stop:1557 length:519 start_codon:yes stop_codon:yes gene_type:complete
MFSFTFKNGDILALRGIKHSEFASHETHCFEASVYFNGKRIGYVSNDGQGGSDNFGGDYKLWDKISARLEEEHPTYYCEFTQEQSHRTMEGWVCMQVNKWLSHKDFKRTMKSKVVFTEPTSDDPKAIQVIGFKGTRKITPAHVAHIKNKYPDYQVLNDMPEADALAIWNEGV